MNIKRVRDRTVFHFNEALFGRLLKVLEGDVFVVACGDGPQQGRVYYQLSDLLAHHAFIGDLLPSAEGNLEHFRDLVVRTVNLMDRLTGACDALAKEYCDGLDLVWEARGLDGSWYAV